MSVERGKGDERLVGGGGAGKGTSLVVAIKWCLCVGGEINFKEYRQLGRFQFGTLLLHLLLLLPGGLFLTLSSQFSGVKNSHKNC